MMVELARSYGKGKISLPEISQRASIPLKYLEQLMIPIKRAGLVASVKGPKGGYMLLRPPEEISIWDILVPLESNSLVDCLQDHSVCAHIDTCLVRSVWGCALVALAQVFKTTTLRKVSGFPLPPECVVLASQKRNQRRPASA